MKKIRFLSLILLLVCVTVFAGCTKSADAKIETCNVLYESVTKNYGIDSQTGKIIVFDEDGNVDLSSVNSWEYVKARFSTDSKKLYNYIATVEEEGSRYVFNILKSGGEYDVIIKAVSNLYLSNNKSSHTLKDADIPQKLKTELYEQIEELGSVLDQVKISKKSLQNTVDSFDDMDVVPVKQALKTFLTNYKLLIEKFFEISSTYDEIISYLRPASKAQIYIGGMTDLLQRSELYLAKYYYLKHFVLVGYDNRFVSEKIYNTQTGQFEANKSYDENFKQTFLFLKH